MNEPQATKCRGVKIVGGNGTTVLMKFVSCYIIQLCGVARPKRVLNLNMKKICVYIFLNSDDIIEFHAAALHLKLCHARDPMSCLSGGHSLTGLTLVNSF